MIFDGSNKAYDFGTFPKKKKRFKRLQSTALPTELSHARNSRRWIRRCFLFLRRYRATKDRTPNRIESLVWVRLGFHFGGTYGTSGDLLGQIKPKRKALVKLWKLRYIHNKKFLDSTNKEMNLKRLNTMKTVNERTTYTSKKVIVANVCASESFGA